ncbi:hypothetical protein Bpla01_12830 [Burkholderia plantarii]|nr:hypothetical protein Bpla01_12830 [Burkholderia plantarii]
MRSSARKGDCPSGALVQADPRVAGTGLRQQGDIKIRARFYPSRCPGVLPGDAGCLLTDNRHGRVGKAGGVAEAGAAADMLAHAASGANRGRTGGPTRRQTVAERGASHGSC